MEVWIGLTEAGYMITPPNGSGAVHDSGQAFDHRQAGYVSLQLGDEGRNLLSEHFIDLNEVSVLHLDAVAQVGRDVCLQKFPRHDPVDHVTRDGHVEFRKQASSLLG